MLALVFAVVLLVPGLLAALSACAMAECGPPMPVVSAAGHDCCPQATTEIGADCCPLSLASPAAPPKLPERLDASATPIVTAVAAAQPPSAPVAGSGVAAAPPQLQLDSLAQGCILRI